MLTKTHKHRKTMSWQSKSAAVAIAIMAMSLHSSSVQAMPEQGKVVAGQGEIARPDDKTMVINQKTDRLALDWQKFNIAKDEKVHFDQNSKSAIAINRVVGDGRSIIDGLLSAKGHVFVINPNGVLFGKNSSVDVGGLVASTANVTDDDLKNFTQGKGDLGLQIAAGREASVINAGTIKAEGGLVALHATTVENTGTIANEGGTTALAAAKNLNIAADTAGKLNFTVNGSLANAKALNSGTLQSDGGYIVMTAKSAGDVMSTVVNNTGIIEAKTLHTNDKGEILLDGGASGQVEVSGTLNASGMEAGQSAGSIKVIGAKTIVNDGTNLLARGTIDGGKIETSGDVLDLGNNLNIDASGDKGSHGTWLLDPLEVIISAEKPTSADHDYGTVVGDTNGKTKNNVIFNDPPSGQNADNAYNSTTWINSGQVGDILSKGTDVIIQAISASGAASITLESPIDIKVSNSASKNPTFTLEANRNITINQNITARPDGKGLNIMLNADTDGDGIGAVIMNADVTTNGGWFKSATGGSVTHTYGKGTADQKNYGTYNGVSIGGDPNHDGATVGTYFGDADSAKSAHNRSINTNGGALTLNGEVGIGLNGGTLILNTNGGALTVTGIVNSGNGYDYYYYDPDTNTWNKPSDDTVIKQINEYVDKVLNDTEGVPMYEYKGINYSKDKDGKLTWTYDAVYYSNANNGPHYVFRPLSKAEADDAGQFITSNTNNGKEEDITNFSHTLTTSNPKWYLTKQPGWGFNSFIVTGKSSMTISEFLTYLKNTYGDKTGFKSRYPHETDYKAFTDAEKTNLRKDITSYLAHNWYVAQEMASAGSTGNGDQVGDSYLATITTRLENSLTTPNGAHIMWAGGRGSGVRNRDKNNDANNVVTWYPADPTHPDGFYWVTGPEGLVKDNVSTYENTTIGTGTIFWDTSSSNVKTGNYGKSFFGEAHWSQTLVGPQPDDNGPFLTVGYGSDNQWDDANFGGETTWGFVRETNLAHSSLNIQAGKGAVNLQGNIGGSGELDTVKINTTGSVTTGGSTVTDYNMGTINADHGVTINSGDVMIGGRITTGSSTNSAISNATDNVSITSAGNLKVHGITANGKTGANGTVVNGGKISLVSDSDKGIITIEGTTNSKKGEHKNADGTEYAGDEEPDNGGLIAGSSADGAVVIDSRGKTGAFINKTTSDKAIDTKGTWQVYVASPSDYGTVLKDKKDNLNSGTNAQWSSESTKHSATDDPDKNAAGKDIGTYTDHTQNKFIFQVTPVITISGGSQQKTYGDTLTDDQLRDLLSTSATYTDSTGKDVDVTQFSNFNEADYLTYVTSSDGTGTNAVAVSSDGADAKATRTDGNEKKPDTDDKKPDTDDYRQASDGNRAFYVFKVDKNGAKALNGYDLETANGDIEILKRNVTVNANGHITYGSEAGITYDAPTPTTGLPNGDTISLDGIPSSTEYQTKKGSRKTADVGKYQMDTDSIQTIILNKGNDVSANYNISANGTLIVDKAVLVVDTAGGSKVYGDTDGVLNDLKLDTAVSFHLKDSDAKTTNGDNEKDIFNALGLKVDSPALIRDKDGNPLRTNNVNENPGYDVEASFNHQLSNYVVETGKVGKEKITPKDVYFHVTGNGKTIGDVVYTVTDTNPRPDYPLNPNDPINSQLVYGETVTPSYRPDGRLPNGHYGVSTTIDGRTIPDNGVYGNYRYHYDGDVTVNMSNKPDILPPVNPPVTPGTGTVTPLPEQPTNPSSNTPENTTETTDHKTVWDGERDRGGDRPEDKRVVTLPFFKVLEDKTTHRYGTYDVAKRTTEVKIEPSAQVLPEPNQPATQYRELTTELTTDKGTGEFTLKYNGSRFTILPDDDAAMKLIVVGDETKNRALFEKALHVAFTQMGLEVADLDGVYIHFGKD